MLNFLLKTKSPSPLYFKVAPNPKRYTDGWKERWMDGHMGGGTDKWMDGKYMLAGCKMKNFTHPQPADRFPGNSFTVTLLKAVKSC